MVWCSRRSGVQGDIGGVVGSLGEVSMGKVQLGIVWRCGWRCTEY